MITHEESYVLRKIKEGIVQETILVGYLMSVQHLARWEAWRVIHSIRRSGFVTEEYAERKNSMGRTVKVLMFSLTEKGERLF